MSVQQSVVRQTIAYRQGLVLGLTMAEVVLLIIFALLLALAAAWKVIEADNVRLRHQVEEARKITSFDSADLAVLTEVAKHLQSSRRSEIISAIERIASGEHLVTLSSSEARFVSEVRARNAGSAPSEIDKHWRELTFAAAIPDLRRRIAIAEAVAKQVPPETNPQDVEKIVEAGLRSGEHSWPPIILLEKEGYRFEKNQAVLSSTFELKLQNEIVPTLIDLAAKFRVDIIEVIGHTDEQAIAQRHSNLDRNLLATLRGTAPVASLAHGDNAGLGLSRAVAVIRALTMDGRLAKAKIRALPLSGGQLIDTDDTITVGRIDDLPERRRIEIRARRSR